MNKPARDFVGYGRQRPTGRWPNGSKLAVNVVVNYEEGSERSFAMDDTDQEPMTEWGAYPFPRDIRNLAMESMYEYGSRVGVWRVLDGLNQAGIRSTFFACAVAFEQNPEVAAEVVRAGHEVCSHGYRWEEVFRLTRDQEREHIRLERRTPRGAQGLHHRSGSGSRRQDRRAGERHDPHGHGHLYGRGNRTLRQGRVLLHQCGDVLADRRHLRFYARPGRKYGRGSEKR
ncbi:polysaccharide deacetylase family protein [Paracoccus angustae]|uniref:Chitooligosaccharide deacetylase n=1 Tax=Paracoccus angustae TaxID=1671480 RepID=A0ABV7U7U4_9RHOB